MKHHKPTGRANELKTQLKSEKSRKDLIKSSKYFSTKVSYEKPHCTTRASKRTRKDFSLFLILPWAVTNYICTFPNPKSFPIARGTTFQMEKGRSSRPFLLRGRHFFFFLQLRKKSVCLSWHLFGSRFYRLSSARRLARHLILCKSLTTVWSCNTQFGSKWFTKWRCIGENSDSVQVKICKILSRPHGRDFGNSVSATHHTHLAANTPTPSNTQTQRPWLLLLAGSWRGQNCLSRMAAHGLFLCSFIPADQNNKLSKCDGENLHFNIPQISVCSSGTRAAVYAAK